MTDIIEALNITKRILNLQKNTEGLPLIPSHTHDHLKKQYEIKFLNAKLLL